MDLSRLTRPAILCQCSRCSSSLAALENEWAKLSNSYSIAAGWLSVELHRISISSEKKQIPQSSDLSLIRGRIIQEISCKLCQQKLGVLCALETGPNIFWKLSKVSFREIVTMRTVEPVFKDGDGVLESLLFPPKILTLGQGTPTHHGALVSTGSDEIDTYSISVEQQIQHQGLSLDHISSSVSNLHDTMYELKQAFTALRIELNGPGRIPNEIGNVTSGEFNMIAMVLRELKSKSDEIEKLKLEIEALKLRNRYMEEQATKQARPSLTVETMLPEVGTPGLLQGARKRPYPDHFPNGRSKPIADSFDGDGDDDEDSMAEFSLEATNTNMPPIRIPLRDAESRTGTPRENTRLQIEVGQSIHQTPHSTDSMSEPIIKRRRLSPSVETPPPTGNPNSERRKPGRPRKSISQTTKPDLTHNPKPLPLNEQNGNTGNSTHKDQVSSTSSPNNHRNSISTENRPTRSRTLRSRSRPPSPNSRNRLAAEDKDKNVSRPDETQPPGQSEEQDSTNPTSEPIDLDKENPPVVSGRVSIGALNENKNEVNEKRKAQTAARDIMAKLAMQREEAMDTEEAR